MPISPPDAPKVTPWPHDCSGCPQRASKLAQVGPNMYPGRPMWAPVCFQVEPRWAKLSTTQIQLGSPTCGIIAPGSCLSPRINQKNAKSELKSIEFSNSSSPSWFQYGSRLVHFCFALNCLQELQVSSGWLQVWPDMLQVDPKLAVASRAPLWL